MDEQKLIDLQDEYSSALASGNHDRVRDLEKQLDDYITQGSVAEAVKEPEKVEENTDPADEPAKETPEAADTTSPSETESSGDTKEGEPAPKQETSETEDWLASLDPKIRERVEKELEEKAKLSHRIKADEGRVAAYQRRYEEQRKLAVQQEELIKKLKSSTAQMPQGQKNATAAPKPTTNSLSIDDDPDLKQIAETDEQLARTMLRREQLLRDDINQLRDMLDERLSPIQKSVEEATLQTEWNKLVSVVPNAKDVFQSQGWAEWVSLQSPTIRAIAESDFAEDTLKALELYAADMQRWYPQQPNQPQEQQQKVPNPKAEKVQQERERKLQAQPVGSASVRPPQKAEPTLEEIMANPELLEKYQQDLYKKELERMGKPHLA